MNDIIKRRIQAVKDGTAKKITASKHLSIIEQRLQEVKEKEAKGLIPPFEERLKNVSRKKKAINKEAKLKREYNKQYYQKIKAEKSRKRELDKTSDEFQRKRLKRIGKSREYNRNRKIQKEQLKSL